MSSRLFLSFSVCLIYACGCQKATEQKLESNADKPIGQSTLYEQFDPNKLREKYTPKFIFVRKTSSDSGFVAKSTGDLFKSVVIQGDISNQEFQTVFESVQSELFDFAKSSSVTISGEPNSNIKERPDWLLTMFFSKPDLVHGSYFTFSQGPIQGAVEILSQATGQKKTPGWNLTVVLHEKQKTVSVK